MKKYRSFFARNFDNFLIKRRLDAKRQEKNAENLEKI